ncbi:hypothetical protein [Actinoplanes sp. L3-i22]|uniref:hypothetical protein n=1 Tax=Actinoplanes sp. L3-i22 TaxID=2836373 RepID=UPI001C84F956|nr:hypothetical protein [Actinoplanes sp. L3-i22]
MMKRALTGLVVLVVAVCGGIGVYGQVRRHHRETYLEQLKEQKRAARTPLQRTASEIERQRRTGATTHFAVVPKALPPELVLLAPVEGPDWQGVTDIYSYGELKVVVRYTADPGDHPCGDQTCLRDTKVGVTTAEAPSLTHASIWLTGTAASPEQETRIRQFWTTTTWVPTAGADWFTQAALQGDVP